MLSNKSKVVTGEREVGRGGSGRQEEEGEEKEEEEEEEGSSDLEDILLEMDWRSKHS